MKRLLSLIVLLVVLVGAFTSCDLISNIKLPWGNKTNETDIMEAIDQLDEIYEGSNGAATVNDYELIAQLSIDGTVFNITWASDNSQITFELVDGFWYVSVPKESAEQFSYKLIATITTEGGQKASVEYNRVIPQGGNGMITNPEIGKTYKLAVLHGSLNQLLFFRGEPKKPANPWYLGTTDDVLAAVDVTLEPVDGVADAFRLSFYKDGEKQYLRMYPRDGAGYENDGTIELTTECPEEYFTYDSEHNAIVWTHTNGSGSKSFLCCSGTYDTIQASSYDKFIESEGTYIAFFYGPGGVEVKLPEVELPEVPENYTNLDVINALYELKAGQTLEGPYYLTGIVTSIHTKYDPAYGNVSFNLVVEGATDKPILVYRIKGEGMVDVVKPGDTVKIFVGLTNYNGTYETTSGGQIIELTPGDPSDIPDNPGTDTPETPAGAVVLDMMGLGNRTSYSTTQTIYEANGIKFTNDKASSSTDNHAGNDYAARVYAGATVKIEYKGMTKIVLTLDDYSPEAGKDYLKGFDGMTVDGATITRDGDTVTIIFAAATDVFQSGNLSSQIRIEKVEVYTGEVENPGEGGNQGGTDTPAYTAPEAGKAYYFFVDQKGLNKTIYFNGNTADQRLLTGDKTAAVEIYFEVVDGGYHIYFNDASGAKKYINTAPYLKDNKNLRCRIDLGDAPNCVWTYDTTLGILEAAVEFEGKTDTFFFGTYESYETISLSGSYYRDQIATGGQYPARIEAADGSTDTPSQPEHQHSYVDGKCSCGATDPNYQPPTVEPGEDTAGLVGKAYKLYLTQGNLNKTLYFTGAMDGNFLATTDVEANGADIYFEAVEGGYHVYFMVNGVKTYLVNSPYIKSNGYIACGINIGTAPNCVWTYNTELGILEVYAELDGKNDTFFLGTHSQYNTMSLSGSFYKDKIGDGTQFPAYIKLAEGGNTDTPSQPEHQHTFVDGKCSCGETDPNYQPPTVDPETPDGTTSIADALAAAEGTVVTLKGTVTSFYETWSSYGNCSPYIVDANGDKILVFRTTTRVSVGDQITVTGTVTNYKGTNQIAQDGSVVVIDVPHTCKYSAADCLNPAMCESCDAVQPGSSALGHTEPNANGRCDRCGTNVVATYQSVSLSFSNVSNRTSLSSEAQVWEANGIKFTNNRAGNTNGIADYSNPVRLYKSTEAVIEYTGMKKIDITCNNDGYATTLLNTLSSLDGCIVNVNGTVVTVEFDSAVNSFTFELSVGQVRVDSLTVYY